MKVVIIMPKVTFGDAIKSMWHFLTGHDKPEEEKGKKPDDNLFYCKKCKTPMSIKNQSHATFASVVVYNCPNCHSMVEQQFNIETGEINKEIYIYNPMNDKEQSQMEVFNMISYNNFDLNRLWSISGTLCYPVLMRSEFSRNISLIFVSCKDSIKTGTVDAFIINEHRMICSIHLTRHNEISYFCNPYFTDLPHTDFGFISYPTEINDQLEYVSRVRYSYKVKDNDGIRTHELTIIEDFPLMTMGVEIYLKFIDYNNSQDTIPVIAEKIKLIDRVLGKEVTEIDEKYSMQAARMHQINLFSYTTNQIKPEVRKEFAKDIMTFIDYIS